MQRQKTVFILLAVFILIHCTSLCFSEQILIMGNHKKPPKVYLENGKEKGILIDIMKYIDQKIPQSFQYNLYPWKRAYAYSKAGKGGIIGFSMNSERLELFDYSDVMYYDNVVLVVIKGHEFSYQNIHDLRGKRVGAQRGASYGDDFEKAKNTEFFLDVDDNSEQRLLKLLGNRIDVAILGPGKASVNFFIKKNKKLSKSKEEFVIISNPLKRDPNYLAFEKNMNKQGLLREINMILKKGYESGDIQKIIENNIGNN